MVDRFTVTKEREVNLLVADILEKRKIVEGLSADSLNDGILQTVGSPTWKALIRAAKELNENEKAANKGQEPAHCMRCHQKLTRSAQTLFERYWQFLESKAESELTQLLRRQTALVRELRSAKALHPKLLDRDAGVKDGRQAGASALHP